MKNNKTTEKINYEAFLQWHAEATTRLREGESLAAPSSKFFESWSWRRIDEAVHNAIWSQNYTEAAILVDLREAWRCEQKKENHRTFAEVGPVSVEKI